MVYGIFPPTFYLLATKIDNKHILPVCKDGRIVGLGSSPHILSGFEKYLFSTVLVDINLIYCKS